MKFLAMTITALAALAAAAPEPHPPSKGCKPATYSCTKNPKTGTPGWQVCDVNHKWVYAGDCPPHTVCKFLDTNGSPYCVPRDFEF